ncbi:MAG: GGDEF domain-containing protein [Candidatus Woesearchaeota archaeon]|nr:GGDEF domain-containing protein [Candidatus Woesearchaeota archaeon]
MIPVQFVVDKLASATGMYVFALDKSYKKLASAGVPPLFIQLIEREVSYQRWMRDALDDARKHSITAQDISGLSNIVVPFDEGWCVIPGLRTSKAPLKSIGDVESSLGSAVPVIEQSKADCFALLAPVLISSLLPVLEQRSVSEHAVSDMSVMLDYLSQVLFVLEPELLLQRTTDFFVDKLKLGNCSIVTDSFTARYHHNPALLSIYSRVESIASAHAQQTKTAFLSQNISADVMFTKVPYSEKLPPCLLVIPVSTGAVLLFSDTSLKEMFSLASGLVERFGKALEKSLLYQSAHASSITDPLTGIFNRAFFSRALARALESAKSVSVCMIDVDNFKKYNDTQGHIAGDKVLQQVASTIKSALGEGCVFSRYGGEEFVFCTSKVHLEAVSLAESCREAVESSCGVTISLGVASGERLSAETLLQEADAALYRAKHDGKNRVGSIVLPAPEINHLVRENPQ